MQVKIVVVAILIALFSPIFTVYSKKNASNELSVEGKKVVEIPESIGYYYPFDGIDLNNFDLVPDLNVAIDVALPILETIYKKSFEKNMPFKGYLKNDSIWVTYGSTPLVEGGFPYIEINKHTGQVMKIIHTK